MEKTYTVPSMYGTMLLREEYSDQKRDDLQWYFNDLYKFFLYTVTQRTHDARIISEEDEKKMLAMLQEIISVKNMLEQDK